MSNLEVSSDKKSVKLVSKRRRKQESSDESSDEEKSLSSRGQNLNGKTEEESQLEDLVFGADRVITSNVEKRLKSQKSLNKKETSDTKVELADNFLERKPVWNDNDDEVEKKVSVKTAALYSKHFGTPIWADLDFQKKASKKKLKKKITLAKGSQEESSDESEDDDDNEQNPEDELFQHTGNLLASKKSFSKAPLPSNLIEAKVCTDANFEEPQYARLKAVEFHPNARVILTGGLNQKLCLFQVDGKKNPKIQSVFIDKFPILNAHFTRTGEEIIIGSRHKSFYYYDLIAGKMVNVYPPIRAIDEHNQSRLGSSFEISPDNKFLAFLGAYGQIHLFSVKSKEYVDSIKISGSCDAIAFSSDSRYLFAFGDDAAVNVFDMNHRGYECLHKFNDFGCLSGTSIAVSPNSQFVATGCKSGVVNLYKLDDCLLKKERAPKPLKSFMNLTTPCTSIKFNHSNEIMSICSAFSENACKLIHLSSMNVFPNFPDQQQTIQGLSSSIHNQIRIPQCIDFSPNSGYFTIGNHKGNALLYRLKHYACY